MNNQVTDSVTSVRPIASGPALKMPKTVAAGVVGVTRKIGKLHRSERNNFAEYNYVSVDAFYEALGPIMAEEGLFVIVDETNVVIDKGMLTCAYEIYLVSEAGDMFGPISSQVTVKAQGPQAYASAKSYVEKYFLRQIFKVPTGEKVDADMHDKSVLPDTVKPQVKKVDIRESVRIASELIAGLQSCQTIEDLRAWEKVNGTEVKRKLSEEHAASVDDEYTAIKEALLKRRTENAA